MSLNKDFQEQLKQLRKKCKILIIALVCLCILLISILIYNERNSFTTKLAKYPYLDPTSNLLEQKDAITNIQPLKDYMDQLGLREKDKAKVSVYFEYLNTGANISLNKDEKIWPVSLAKLPLAMVVMKKIENGIWDENDDFEIGDENVNSGSGDLYKEGVDHSIKAWRLITEMLENSDNTAYRVFKRNTTQEERTEVANEIGLGELFDENGKVSAKEYSRILRSLYTASYLNQENSQKLLKLLTRNRFKDFLNQGMPESVVFAHKQGENVRLNVYADSGIVYLPNRPYIISVMVEPLLDKDSAGKQYAQGIMKEISNKVYDYIKNK